MALVTRRDIYNLDTRIRCRTDLPSCRLLSLILGRPIPATSGQRLAHESGIHQDGMLKNRETYEIMTPESIGRTATDLVGKHSGPGCRTQQTGKPWLSPRRR